MPTTTTLSSAEWTGILFDCILFELSGKPPSNNNECDIKDISNALLLAWHIHKRKPHLFACPFDNHIRKKDLNSIGIEQYINTTRRFTFSIFPHQPSISTRHVPYRVAGKDKQGVLVKDFLPLPSLSSSDTQTFLDRYATLVPSRYHDDFATLILLLRNTWWKHGGSGGSASVLPSGVEGVTKFSKKHNDRKRPTNTYFPPGELERLRLAAQKLKSDIETRQQEKLARLEVIMRQERLEAVRVEAERVKAARLEAERVKAARLEAERVKAARLEAERVKAARLEAERVKAARLEAERVKAARLEAERVKAARLEAERVKAARLEAERVKAARLEAERVKAARLEAERAKAARLEAERVKAERLKAARLEAVRVEAKRLKAARLEAERVKAERLKAARLEAERVEAQRLEAERVEAERLEAERVEAERLEAERLEAERMELEQLERQRRLKDRQEQEERQKRELARLQALEKEQEEKQQKECLRILQEQMDAMRLDEARLEEQRRLKMQETEEQSKKREKRRKPKIDDLSEYLSAIQVSQRSRPSNNKNIMALCQTLQERLQLYTYIPTITVHLFGSFRSGLCRMESDADFTVYNFVQPYLEGNPIDELAKALRWAGCQSVTTIATARVPIVKFVAWGVQCDMSIDQPMAVHNSKLIGAYRMVDKRFLKLWFAVRYIARNHGILSGSAGYLSSYALVMMLIVFLQDVANPPILPRLQQQDRSRMEECKIDGYDCSFDNKGHRYRTFGDTNTTATSQLLIDLCQFYGYIFNYATQEVNPYLGVIKDRTYDPPPRSEWDPRPRDWSICILDPFVVGWNVAGNCRNNNAAEIQQCFRTAFDALSVKDIKKAFKQ